MCRAGPLNSGAYMRPRINISTRATSARTLFHPGRCESCNQCERGVTRDLSFKARLDRDREDKNWGTPRKSPLIRERRCRRARLLLIRSQRAKRSIMCAAAVNLTRALPAHLRAGAMDLVNNLSSRPSGQLNRAPVRFACLLVGAIRYISRRANAHPSKASGGGWPGEDHRPLDRGGVFACALALHLD